MKIKIKILFTWNTSSSLAVEQHRADPFYLVWWSTLTEFCSFRQRLSIARRHSHLLILCRCDSITRSSSLPFELSSSRRLSTDVCGTWKWELPLGHTTMIVVMLVVIGSCQCLIGKNSWSTNRHWGRWFPRCQHSPIQSWSMFDVALAWVRKGEMKEIRL